MRVLFVGPVPPLRGGIAQHGARLVEALRERHDVDVLTWKALYPPLLYRHAQRDPDAAPFPGARARLAWQSPASWRAAGREGRAAALVVLPWVTPFHWLACRVVASAARPTPTVAIVHNALPHEPMPLQRALTRAGLARAAGVVVHSAVVRDELAALLPLRPVLVPHPPNLALAPTPLPPRPPLRLLFLGFVRAYKGLDVALEALALLRDGGHDARLTVAGEFWEPLETWRARVAAARLEERVELRPGYQSDEALRRLLAEHHVLVAPYRSATQSGVVPLAQAAGRPTVATDVGGLAAQVGDGGLVVPPGDARALAAAIAATGEALERRAAAAAARASRWSDVADAVLAAGGLA